MVLLIILATILPRLYYPNKSKWEIDHELVKDEHGNYYLYQADSWYYYNMYYNGSDTFMFNFSLFPLVFAILIGVLLFYFLSRLTDKIYLAFLGTILFVTNQYYLYNSYIGYADTNSINLFLTLCIISTLVIILINKTLSVRIINLIALIVSIVAFSLIWQGWWYIIFIIATGFVSYMIFNVTKKRLLITILPVIMMFIVFFDIIKKLILDLILFSGNVNEFATNFDNIFILFYGFITGITFICLYFKNRHELTYNIINVWFWITLMSGLIARRFTVYFILPFIIVLCLCCKRLPKNISKFILILICMFSFSITTFMVIESSFTPMMDDSIIESMEYINDNIPKDYMLIGMWDQGHLYLAYVNNKIYYRGTKPEFDIYKEGVISSNETYTFELFNNVSNKHVVVLDLTLLKKHIYDNDGNTINDSSFIIKGLFHPEQLIYYDVSYCTSNTIRKLCILRPKTT